MMNRSGLKLFGKTFALLLVFVVLFFNTIVHFATEVLWYQEVGYLDTYYKILFSKVVLAVPLFLIVYVLLFLYLGFIKRKIQKMMGTTMSKKNSATKLFFGGIALISALYAYLIADRYWMEILKFVYQSDFQITDPIFNKDIAFYMFTYPLIDSVFNIAINSLVLLILLTLAYGGILYSANPPSLNESKEIRFFGIKTQYGKLWDLLSTTIMIVSALIFAFLAMRFYLDNFKLLYSARGAVFGAGYTDVNVTMWVNRVKMILSAVLALLLFAGGRSKRKKYLLASGIVLLAVVGIVGEGVEFATQNLKVSPNELRMEKPYIENSIRYTNLAYGLDKIQIKDFKVDQNLSIEDIANNEQTLSNVSINDERPALETFNQLQGFRSYYQFHDVDIDRYMIDGEIQQMFLSARELNKESLDENAQSWINSKLKYTHGYGVAVAPASRINKAGQPDMVVKNMPVQSSIPTLNITRPQIYFGELTNDYVIVNTMEEEFDYPKGDTNETTEYEGKAGIKLGFLNRLLYAIRYKDLKLFISSGINAQSRILTNRNVVGRIRKIAPFLTFEEDAYTVIVNGKIYFVLDGYTLSGYYPYSEPFDGKHNYIRNSVKAVVDAYDGTVEYYISDTSDPIIRTYEQIFNKMFIPMENMDPQLKAHMRYPKTIFEIMSKMYLTFHATDPNVFYNREDKWSVPTETYQSDEMPMSPLYFTFKLPEEDKAEFLLSIPFTPLNKQTLTAFLVARNDGEHYGELVLYRFPKDRSIIGPQQIEAQISNNDVISRDLSLWDSQGSEVIRGHILTIPMESSILYIEPLYIRASSETAIPEVKRIIVAHNSNIVMAESLDLALEKIFGKSTLSKKSEAKNSETGTNQEDIQSAIQYANELYEKAQEALRNGSLSEYERLIHELGDLLKRMN